MKRDNIIIAILGGMLLGCCISVSIPIIKVNVLTNRYEDELKEVVVNYMRVPNQAELEGNPDLLMEVATGKELEFLQRVYKYPLETYGIITSIDVDSFQVSSYTENRATISIRGYFWHYHLYSSTGETSNEWDTPFYFNITLVKEEGVWKVSDNSAHHFLYP